MTVRGIDDQHVDTGLHQCLDALLGIATGTDRRTDPQAPLFILAGIREVGGFLDILDRDHAAQVEVAVDHQHALDTVLVQQRDHLVLAGALRDRDQPVLRRHDTGDRQVEVGFKTPVAAGDDAHQVIAVHHRHAGNVIGAGQLDDLANTGRGETVIGSLMTPLSNFLTRWTSAACCAGVRFLWMMPMPPSWARVIASRDSVTVSMAADSSGIFSSMSRVS